MPTPNNKTKFKATAQIRSMTLTPAAEQTKKRFDVEQYVEGYAARYDKYLLYDLGEDGKVYERFERGCFDETDMSDVIMQFDHEGRVYARTTNNTLVVEPDNNGLFTAADLSRTKLALGLHEDIKAGMITKMSWRFRVGDYYVERTDGSRDITIVHTKVRKIYDVSVVSIPANDKTEINARSLCDGLIAEEARREAELNDLRIRIKTKILTGGN